MNVKDVARRGVHALGLAPAARQVRTAARRARADLAERLAVPEPELARRDRIDNERIDLLLAMVLREGSNCIDVGAHEGAMIEAMRRIAPKGRHIAYEPLPHLNAALQERFPGLDVRSTALSNVREDTTFQFVRNMPGMSGLRERWYPGGEPETEILAVHTERLDDDLPRGYVPDLIKIDVEGAELFVLEGARNTLRAYGPLVIFEYGRGTQDTSYGTTPRMIWDFFADLDYRLFDLAGHGPLRYEEFSTMDAWNWVAHR